MAKGDTIKKEETGGLFGQMRSFNRSWPVQLRDLRQLQVEFATQLRDAKTAAASAGTYKV